MLTDTDFDGGGGEQDSYLGPLELVTATQQNAVSLDCESLIQEGNKLKHKFNMFPSCH